MDDIIQKNIQIPCIFGDRSLILKSLENETGLVKLPLYILTSKGIKVDVKREADLHVDIFYQMDESFSKLPKNHPAYKPYSLKKRRGLPIIISYDLTLITKYKEDLDQMLTNWMVHWRPDIYVKWWHPKKKNEPLQSEILWDQNINMESNTDNEGKSKFQWKANTSFEFKTWVFPGLNYYEDSLESDLEQTGREHEPLIQKFQIFNVNHDYEQDVDINEDTGYPVLGNLFEQSDPAKNAQLDFQVISDRLTNLDDVYNWQLSSELYPGPVTDEKYFTDADIVYHKYSDYMIMPPILNERIQIKYTYFNNALPLSAMNSNPPSGDILFNTFSKEIEDNRFNIHIRQFGDCFSDSLSVKYSYNIQQKSLTIYGQKLNQTYYTLFKSILSQNSINQQLCVSGTTLQDNIKFNMIRKAEIDTNTNQFNILSKLDDHNHISLWNDVFNKRQHMNNMQNIKDWDKYQAEFQLKSSKYAPKFLIENNYYNHILSVERNLFIKYFDKIQLENQQNNTYKMYYSNRNFWKITEDLNCYPEEFQLLEIKQIIQENENTKYLVLVNNWLYIILKQTNKQSDTIETEVYDFGVVSLPIFDIVPIFNINLPQSKVVYGLNTQYKISIMVSSDSQLNEKTQS